MIRHLTDKERAQLHVKFAVPLAVANILRGLERFDDVTEYALQEVISELQPDTALLCIALCAQHIASSAGHLHIARVLGAEASGLVEKYGPLWIDYEKGVLKGAQARKAEDVLLDLPEDLELIGDLLLVICGVLGEDMAAAAILSDILGQQALAFRDYAESELESVNIKAAVASAKITASVTGVSGSNIIPFPIMALRRPA